ncbi:hypothetical protein ANO14919_039920 [Xylariales sp. No.14919]|nr:hypothetical protein ANO14919_039920 [Xylariales sp. No.14919]
MAENSARGNIIDAADAPKGGADTVPPPVSEDVKDAVRKTARGDVGGDGGAGVGVHASGQEEGFRTDLRVGVETVDEVRRERKDGVDTARAAC